MREHFLSSPDWAALARYLSGESDLGEAEAIRRWIAASSERPALVDALRQVWAEATVPREEWDVEAALPRIMRGAPSADLAARRWTSPWVRLGRGMIAAAAVAILAVGFTLWQPAILHWPLATTGVMREYVTQRGQYVTFVLVDGTRITLGPQSQLRVPLELQGATRDVYLQGQALFRVTHDSARVFRVHTARAVATDLGTTFVVRAYTDVPHVDVMVAEGLVSLVARARVPSRVSGLPAIVLRPGDLGHVGAGGTVDAEHGVDADAYTAWTEGRLVFRRTPLREVAAELARWYDFEVRIPDSAVAARRVTASFDNQPAADVLRFVALSLGLRYELRGRAVILTPFEATNQAKP